jgi:hypothetical protein
VKQVKKPGKPQKTFKNGSKGLILSSRNFLFDNLGEIAVSRLIDQSLLNALSADADPFYATLDLMAHCLKIWLPEFLGFIIGVRNDISILRGFATDFTDSGHLTNSF